MTLTPEQKASAKLRRDRIMEAGRAAMLEKGYPPYRTDPARQGEQRSYLAESRFLVYNALVDAYQERGRAVYLKEIRLHRPDHAPTSIGGFSAFSYSDRLLTFLKWLEKRQLVSLEQETTGPGRWKAIPLGEHLTLEEFEEIAYKSKH